MAKKTKSTSVKKKSSNKILCKDGKIKKKIPKLFTAFKCNICNKEFSDKYGLTSHAAKHSTETPFACPHCPYRGKTKKYAARHIRTVHSNIQGKHACGVCGKLFQFESGLKVHAMVHSGEKPHVCNVCGKSFRVTYSLNSHMLIHKDVKPFQCSFCEYACRDSSTLRKHQNRHMNMEQLYVCKFCNKPYKTKTRLKLHISETHLEINVRKYPCGRCDRVFKTTSQKNQHIKSVHDRLLSCNCPLCGARMASKYNLPAHMKKHLNERPFSCTHPGCTATFKVKNYLHKHKFIHNTKMHFPCSFCGRKFSRQARRDRHERILHIDRKRSVTCHYCGSSFYSKNYLIKHIQIKHIYRQTFKYICDICGLTTFNKPSIVMHLKYGHLNDGDMVCKICDNKRVFKKHLYLKLHYWKSHNIKYKMTRSNKRKEKKPMVDVKVEPLELDSFEEIPLMDIDKKELEEYDSLDYSKQVLSEDVAEAAQRRDVSPTEVVFDDLFIRQMFKQHDTPPEPSNEGVNLEQVEYVNRKIKQLLIKTQKIQKVKELRRKKEIEEQLRKKNERQEIIELKRVREMYNERMKAAVVREKKKKDPIKVKFFKQKAADVLEKGNNNDNKRICNENEDSNNTESINDENNDTISNDYGNNDKMDNTPLSGNNCNDVTKTVPDIEINSQELCEQSDDNGFIKIIDPKYAESFEEQNDKVIESDKCYQLDVTNGNVCESAETLKINRNIDKNNFDDSNINICDSNNQPADNEDITKTDHQKYKLSQETQNYSMNFNDKVDNYNDTINENYQGDKSSPLDTQSDNDLSNFDKEIAKNDDLQTEAHQDLSHLNQNNSNNDDFNNQSGKSHDNDAESFEENDDNKSDDDKTPSDDESWKNSDESNDEEQNLGKAKLIKFHSHQCYVCFKLYPTKQELIEHCQDHFDLCNERTLTKCPICSHVSYKSIAGHMKKTHNVKIKIPVFKIQDRKSTEQGSRYCYDVDGTTVEVIPSVKILNKTASNEIDRKRRDLVNNTVATTKLVKKGKEWVVEKVAVDIKYDEIPEFDDKTLAECKISDNDVDRLGQLNYIAKKKGLKIMFPCFKCDKVCQNFSALKLHKRRHEDNPKPFAPRVKNRKKIVKKVKLDIANRTAFPKPIVSKHYCDKKLKDFFESNIRGGDIEFWQFLKIINKMDRENVNDFKDLEDRTDFGIHYYKNDELENNGNELGNNDDELEKSDDGNRVTKEVKDKKRPNKAKKSMKRKKQKQK